VDGSWGHKEQVVFIEHLEGRRMFSGAAKFAAQLLGASEVPANVTPAKGSVKFKLSRDGSALTYKLSAKKIDNVSGAHIHLGAPGADGEIVADLTDAAATRVGRHKFSARGVITATQLTGSLAGHALADLVAQMTAGATYVNVHTDDGVAPPNTGSGDFPGGEVRGQIRRLGRQAANAPGTTPVTDPLTNPMPGY
jgi:hypothetical protein